MLDDDTVSYELKSLAVLPIAYVSTQITLITGNTVDINKASILGLL